MFSYIYICITRSIQGRDYKIFKQNKCKRHIERWDEMKWDEEGQGGEEVIKEALWNVTPKDILLRLHLFEQWTAYCFERRT